MLAFSEGVVDDDAVGQQLTHFRVAEEFEHSINKLLALDETSNAESEAIVEDLITKLNFYQEQPHLLDPHLEVIVRPIVLNVRQRILRSPSNANNIQDVNRTRLELYFRYLYILCKVRGSKTIVQFFTHEVSDLEPFTSFYLSHATNSTWETRYICLIWLSLIYIIPFDLAKVDSEARLENRGKIPIVEKLLDRAKSCLLSSGREQSAAAILISRMLSRKDISEIYLSDYIIWTATKLKDSNDVFLVTGVLSSLCELCAYAPREMLLNPKYNISSTLLSTRILETFKHHAVARKLFSKLVQRVGLTLLRPRSMPRFLRGTRSLEAYLSTVESADRQSEKFYADQDQDDNAEVPEEIEVVVDILLTSLCDKDTIVRWSAAKGLARICQRLPAVFADEIIQSVLALFHDNLIALNDEALDIASVSDQTWHGACLALAEMIRRGSMSVANLGESMPFILRALKFDQKKGSHSIGTHVRDAACYVCWCLARAYDKSDLTPFTSQLSTNLVVVSCYDRDINIRRAASAAYQEHVGRLGLFPHGIQIVQIADYFAVGNRARSFEQVSVEIAQYEEYTHSLVEHLVNVSSVHWDKQMRQLSARTLGLLTAIDPQVAKRHLPRLSRLTKGTDLNSLHGSLLAVGEISLTLSRSQLSHPPIDLIKEIAAIVTGLDNYILDTFGSENIREASCHLVDCLSRSAWPKELFKNSLNDWRQLIKTSLIRKEESVRKCAVTALQTLVESHSISSEDVGELISMTELSRPAVERRGAVSALGVLPYAQLREWMQPALDALIASSRYRTKLEENDAEAKRNAIEAIIVIIKHLNSQTREVIPLEIFHMLTDHLLEVMDDYSVDQRGDVGSWSREAAMKAMLSIVQIVWTQEDSQQNDNTYVPDAFLCNMVGALLKQGVERIDRTRQCAGEALSALLLVHKESEGAAFYPNIPHRPDLAAVMPRNINWQSPAEVFSKMVPLLAIGQYRTQLLTGLIISAGGLTEALVRHSSVSLLNYIASLSSSTSPSLETILMCILDIFQSHSKKDRVSIPVLEVLGMLFENGTMSRWEDSERLDQMFRLTVLEGTKSKDPRKLGAVIKVLTGLGSLSDPNLTRKCTRQLLAYLCHPYPRIRSITADQLYFYFSTIDDNEGIMEAETWLLNTNW
ncbi:hypothetical protein BZG36_03316 [Bifiguratus adelaidae]|uniref:Uncharacterized protein n=1 Tax=Bifiguratus adelaidae TaxID=1938954 RepID=A0A261XXU7_9FUNG|nr:hypothetical protein BZG36_03316 [Bifiguratus adelaidae]